MSLALAAAFLLSGAAALIFQIVWLYRCGLVFGSSVAAVAVVLSAFMGGLGAGNAAAALFGRRVRDPLRGYAGLEVIVGVSGALVTALLPHLGFILVPIAHATGGSGPWVNAARFLTAFAVMAVPAAAMGATLPMLVAAFDSREPRFGVALGRLYGLNTAGAVAGVVGAEVWLIRMAGVSGAGYAAALMDLAAAGLAMSAVRAIRVAGPPATVPDADVKVGRDEPTPTGEPAALLLAAAALCGGLMLALEVVWFRLLTTYVLVTTLAVSLMLAVVLTGIALGGFAAAAWLRRDVAAGEATPVVACLAGCGVVGAYVLFQRVTSGTQVGEWTRVLWFATVLTLPTSFASGLLFTLIGDRVRARFRDAARSAGWLTLANTAGAVLGAPLATYVWLPIAGMERTLLLVAIGYAVVAVLAGVAGPTHAAIAGRPAGRHRLAAWGALAFAVVAFPFGATGGRYFLRAASAYAADGSVVVATREGPSESLFVMQQQWLGKPVYSRLVTNGFSMSGTALLGQRYMRAFAYYPMLLHDGPLRRALVICYGVGVTAGAVTHVPGVETIEIAEISRDVVAMSDAIYTPDTHPLRDPRVRLHIEDGRFFLQTTGERFDLITGEPPPPRTPGTVNIYTRDYFQLVHDRLNDGGLATYWVPVARPSPGTDINTVIRAFCDVFSDCSLWNATPFDLMLVGSRGLRGPRAVAPFSAPWQTPGIEARLREVGFERPEQIGATFIGDAAFLHELTASTPPLTDDFPQRLRPLAGRPSLSDPGYLTDPAVARMYQSTLDPGRAKAAFMASPYIRQLWPQELIERTAPYFDQQAIINRVYWEGGRPLRQIEDLDAVLAHTTLRTLPLWILGSDEVKQRIAETSQDTTGAVEYARALRALSGRDFGGAAQWLTAAGARGFRARTLDPLLAYAQLASGRIDVARAMTAAARPQDDDERHFWEWMERRMSE